MSEVFDASDEIQINNRKRRVARERSADEVWLLDALKSRAARDFFWRLLERCHIFEVSWVQGSFDATSFREGERSEGNRLLADIVKSDPNAWILMMQEHRKKEDA